MSLSDNEPRYLIILAALWLAGMMGGVGSGLVTPTSLCLKIPLSGGNLKLGFIGDAFIGGIAALAAASIFATFNIDIEPITAKRIFGLIAFGIVTGFTGERLLRRLSTQLLEKLQDRVGSIERQAQCFERRMRGYELLEQKRLREAEVEFKEALKLEPADPLSLIGLGKVQVRVGAPEEAIISLTRLLRFHPDNARAYYNRACYLCVSPNTLKQEVIKDLTEAIRLQPEYARNAQTDKDFQSLWNDPDFMSLVGSKPK
jgi:tetratricopeptide (TPR) repeat protein